MDKQKDSFVAMEKTRGRYDSEMGMRNERETRILHKQGVYELDMGKKNRHLTGSECSKQEE